MSDIRAKGEEYGGAHTAGKLFHHAACAHDEQAAEEKDKALHCITSLLSSGRDKYIACLQDADARSAVRKIPGMCSIATYQ